MFIRHTDDAEEVDEDTFFHDQRSGGTVVYPALELADKIRAERFGRAGTSTRRRPPTATPSARIPPRSARFLREKLLPSCATTPTWSWARRSRTAGRRRCGPSTSAWPRPGAVRDEARRQPGADLSGVPRTLPEGNDMSAKGCSRARIGPYRAEGRYDERQQRHLHRRRLGPSTSSSATRTRSAGSPPSSGSTPTPTRSRSSPPSRCSTPTRRTACPSAIRTGRTARSSSATSRRTSAACRGWPTRS